MRTDARFTRLPAEEPRGVERRPSGWARAAVLGACALGAYAACGWRARAPALGRLRYPTDCQRAIGVWSRGLMRACCDVFPANFTYERVRRGAIARGEHATTDWATVPIRNGSIVYVPSLDVPAFLERFVAFPPSARVTLVSGQEDVGMPRELWGLGVRRDMSVPMRVPLERFLSDERLLHWWVQNYDLVGCNPYSGCSQLAADSPLARKVSPIPIGLDLHTLAEKLPPRKRQPACEQQAEIDALAATLPQLRARPDRLLAPFKCRQDRLDACAALQPPAGIATFFHGARSAMWRAMGDHAFVAAPRGHGVDTHRLWEVLALGSVPVAIASSLDRLYADFPVVTIARWADANASALRVWRARIERQFGAEPFGAHVREALTGRSWAERIGRRHEADMGAAVGAYMGGGALDAQPFLPART
ncbi:hypothetical protein KFE25_012589 [Diacronema lutheri]|uniref:Exostosin GT47 domain-containing protein n=1 Tax=Diacronema lutheri TaxID=2081491 RepID=A0A8J5XHA9_DIALT|nr:hypothetical protein KFE25_012589 [Diacronema lutheri]